VGRLLGEPQGGCGVGERHRHSGVLAITEEIAIAQVFSFPVKGHFRLDRALFRLAYHAGLRASELGLLDMRDYDAKVDRIMVHRLKGSNSGQHHLVREEARALRAWPKVRGSAPGPIFWSQRRQPISRRMLDVLMKQYGALAGIPPKLRHFHVLKHLRDSPAQQGIRGGTRSGLDRPCQHPIHHEVRQGNERPQRRPGTAAQGCVAVTDHREATPARSLPGCRRLLG